MIGETLSHFKIFAKMNEVGAGGRTQTDMDRRIQEDTTAYS
jgi:hypothetical protein